MKYLLIIILISASYSFGQSDNKTLDSLKTEMANTQKKIEKLNRIVGSTETTLESRFSKLASDLATQSTTLNNLVNEKDKALRTQVTAIYDSLGMNTARVTANDTKFKTEQTKSEKNFLYSVIGILSLFLLLVVIYFLIQKRAKSNEQKTGVLDTSTKELKEQISELRASISEEFGSLLEKFASISSAQPATDAAPDHTMVIEFAKQIISMENNMTRIDPEDNSFRRIKRAIENMHNTLKTMDYEITPLLNANIKEGHIIEIDHQEPDESIDAGNRIVYNVVKAEILYKNELLQRGKVKVKVNPNY